MENREDITKNITATKELSCTIKKMASDLLPWLMLVACIIFGLTHVCANVTGHSMEPALIETDKIIIMKTKNVNRGDIITIKKEGYGDIVKRVVGVPGDTITIFENAAYVNCIINVLSENMEEPVVTVLGDDEYFVLGDNRDASTDSRTFGPVKRSEIEGKVTVKLPRLYHTMPGKDVY